MARITDFCCKTAYQNLSKFFCFRSIVRCFQCFVCGSSPFGKVVSHEPPLLLGNYCLWTPPPLGISTDLLWQGYGYFLEPHIPVKALTKDSIKKKRPYQWTCTIISISNWPPTGQEQGVHVHAYCVIFHHIGCGMRKIQKKNVNPIWNQAVIPLWNSPPFKFSHTHKVDWLGKGVALIQKG